MDDMDKMDQVNDMNEPPKSPIPKLPFIIGGVVAAVAVIVILSVALTRIMDDGNGNDGPVHEHSFGEWQTVDAPTCTAAGMEERVCVSPRYKQPHHCHLRVLLPERYN